MEEKLSYKRTEFNPIQELTVITVTLQDVIQR